MKNLVFVLLFVVGFITARTGIAAGDMYALYSRAGEIKLQAVDPGNGELSVLADIPGITIVTTANLEIDDERGLIRIETDFGTSIYNIDEKRITQSFTSGFRFHFPRYNPVDKQFYGMVLENGTWSLRALNVQTEAYREVKSYTGVNFHSSFGAALDFNSGYYYIRSQDKLLRIDLQTGDIAGEYAAHGLQGFRFDAHSGRIYGMVRADDGGGQKSLDFVWYNFAEERPQIVARLGDRRPSFWTLADIDYTKRLYYCHSEAKLLSIDIESGSIVNEVSFGYPVPNLACSNQPPGFGLVKAAIFQDSDGDCMHDTDELPLQYRLLEFLPGPIYGVSNSRGEVSIELPPNIYTARLVLPDFYAASCPDHPYTVSVEHIGELAADLNAGLTPLGSVQVLRLSLAGNAIRRGFETFFTIRIENAGTVPYTGTLRFEHAEGLEFLRASQPEDVYRSNTLEWNLEDVPPGSVDFIDLRFKVSLNVQLGDILCQSVAADKPDGGNLLYGQSDEICEEVTGAFDPNDIQVFPPGNGPYGRIGEADTVLSYLIRFQNTGTDTAFTVVIRDTLSEYHDPRGLIFGAASHPYTAQVQGNRALSFTFTNILLPDSNVNEAASHGYIRYAVRLNKNIPRESTIRNRAAIYFDFNEPVLTNTVSNLYGNTVAVSERDANTPLHVWPNPAGDVLRVAIPPEYEADTLVLVDALGGVRIRRVLQRERMLQLDVSALPTGTYYLKFAGPEGVRVSAVRILH